VGSQKLTTGSRGSADCDYVGQRGAIFNGQSDELHTDLTSQDCGAVKNSDA